MAGEELQVVRLRDDFYRDGFNKVLVALATILAAIGFLIAIILYLYFSEPAPLHFSTDREWRILPPVPLDQPYLNTPDLIQWVSETLPAVLTYDFVNYSTELKDKEQYFTPNGWKKYTDLINIYANYNTIQTSKMFVNSFADGAPFIINQGVLEGKYAWWVQMPINVHYITVDKSNGQPLLIRALVVRVSTLNNLSGVAIENILVSRGGGDQVRVHG